MLISDVLYSLGYIYNVMVIIYSYIDFSINILIGKFFVGDVSSSMISLFEV